MGMPSSNSDLVLMALEAIEFTICLPNVKHLEFAVSTSRQEPISIDWIPPYLVNNIIVCLNLIHLLTTYPWIPHLYIVVFASSQNQTFGRMPVARFNLTPMLSEHELTFSSSEIVNICSVIIRAGDKFEGAIRERKVSNTVLMATEHNLLLHFGV